MVTGNVYPEVERKLPQYPNKTPRAVFRNLGERDLRRAGGGGRAGDRRGTLQPRLRLRGFRQ